jgi:methyl-accepting chemotaxis protein
MKGARPAFGFVFASPSLALDMAVAAVRRSADCSDIVGSTTAGEFTEGGMTRDGVVVMLVASDGATHRVEFGRGLRDGYASLAHRFAEAASRTKAGARASGRRHLTTVLLTDGLAGTGELLVQAIFEQSTSLPQIVGGAAGDGGRFQQTLVAAGDECSSDAAAVLHIFDAQPWGVGVGHGLRPTTKPMRVTRAEGNVLYAIEGQPAFEAYRRHAQERGVTLTRDNATPYLIANELGIHFFASLSRARAPLAVGEDGALTCAAPVPEGSFVSILDGDPQSMIAAAKAAATEARARLAHDAKIAGVLVFDCVCRGMILKDAFADEVQAVRSVFGDVPVAGFLTYGEIARRAGTLEGWHNATAVVAAIPA